MLFNISSKGKKHMLYHALKEIISQFDLYLVCLQKRKMTKY